MFVDWSDGFAADQSTNIYRGRLRRKSGFCAGWAATPPSQHKRRNRGGAAAPSPTGEVSDVYH
jgi:hypothetical protein